jgi:hypothetical protein
MMEMTVREIAYEMGIDGDQAEALEKDVGYDAAIAVLEKVRKKIDYQETLPFHPKKRTSGSIFAQEAANCRVRHAAMQRNRKANHERNSYRERALKSYDNGFRPDKDTLVSLIEAEKRPDDTYMGGGISLKEYNVALRFLQELEE